ncbi:MULTISPECIES: DegT/DnrJ/EryC1/StrS family aminotransferase [Nocardioides]|uniref:DegT/DnrJ/EryC1/StrS family aminotransferase n=1 Tax=Nocardioides vastitatis TaxID=2568655 RepID=A0ABW0ZR88_9ACTN|nr:DegT/DnrJ/EryC1/StrS family aminotransferase [Nocardioides sp.]THJ08452.1 DegT/DnrJ/EryC1/StrS family aminotransferase [Nocardioides sp.]
MTSVSEKRAQIPAEAHSRRIDLLRSDILRLINEVFDAGSYHGAARTKELEAFVGRQWGGHPVATSSGTMALHNSVRRLNLRPGDEVIMPALTFVSTGFAVAYTQAVPVLVDIDPVTRCIDPSAVEAAITHRTRAIIAVHMHGLMADMNALNELAQRHGLAVIEDCAQAAGAHSGLGHAGTIGDFGCFSFWVGKNVGGLHDAGMVVARNPHHVSTLRALADLGRDGDRNTHHLLGHRGRMSEIDAAVIKHQLELLPAWTDRRRQIAAQYSEAFQDLPLVLPSDAADRQHTYYKYAVLTADPTDRAELANSLNRARISTEQVYAKLVHQQPAFQQIQHKARGLHHAQRFVENHLCLPIYPELSDAEITRVIDAVRSHYREENKSLMKHEKLVSSVTEY